MATYIECYERVLKERGRGTGEIVRFHCPFPGCMAYEKRAFCVNVVSGTWCCHHCMQERPDQTYKNGSSGGHGGSAHEFAEMMGDDPQLWPTGSIEHTPKAKKAILSGKKRRELFTAMFQLCQLSDTHRKAILSRGIDPDAAGIVSVDDNLLQRLAQTFDEEVIIRGGLVYQDKNGELVPRYCVGAGRLLIPYYDDELVYYFVGYAKCPKRKPDQSTEDYQALREIWPKISGPAGYTPAIYGTLPAGAEYVIITEGQLKAIAAIQRGFCCIGVQGMMNGHASVIKKCVEAKVKRTILLFDTQAEDQDTVDWASEKLARELLKVGIPTFKVSLPLDPAVDKGQKMDIDSFLLSHGLNEFVHLLCQAKAYELQEIQGDESTEEDNPGSTCDIGDDD